ncbi:unnamed protein product, partial [Phaeothamnion confervicola]
MARLLRGILKGLAAAPLLLAVSLAQASETPPEVLQGKSIRMHWSEEWVQKPVGSSGQYKTNIEQVYVVYVSTAGRVFQRRSIVQDRRPGQKLSVDRVGNEQTGTTVTSFETPDFDGNKMTASRPTSSASTTRATVTFDDKHEGCSATVAHARGSGPAIMTGPATGRKFEIISVK